MMLHINMVPCLLVAVCVGVTAFGAATVTHADLKIVPETPIVEIDSQDWSKIIVRFGIQRGTGPDRDRPYRYTARLYDGVSEVRSAESGSPLTRPKVTIALEAPRPGTYRIEGVVEFADRAECKPCSVPFSLPRVEVVRPKPKLWVVLIGFNSFKDKEIRGLHYAENDVTMLYQVFTDLLGVPPKQVYRFTSAPKDDAANNIYEGTRTKIHDVLRRLKKEVGREDIFIFYYSGHGFVADRDWFLAPLDAAIEGESIKAQDFISFDELARLTDHPQAWHTLVLLDACFSGAASRDLTFAVRGISMDSGDRRSERRLEQLAGGSRNVYAAARGDQLAHEIYRHPGDGWTIARLTPAPPAGAHGHGLFTFSLLRALQTELGRLGLSIDLTGENDCGGRPCTGNLKQFAQQLKAAGKAIAVTSIYEGTASFMRKFEEKYNERRGHTERLSQVPKVVWGNTEGEGLGLAHHDVMPVRPLER